MKLPEKIKAIRESKKLSKNQLAKLAGISQSYVSDLESGKKNPTLDTLEKICDALGITVIELLSFPLELDNDSNIPPDLLHWLEAGKELTYEQRKALLETIDKLKNIKNN